MIPKSLVSRAIALTTVVALAAAGVWLYESHRSASSQTSTTAVPTGSGPNSSAVPTGSGPNSSAVPTGSGPNSSALPTGSGPNSSATASATTSAGTHPKSGKPVINAVFPPLQTTDRGYNDFSYILSSPLVDGINPALVWASIDKGPGAAGGQYQWSTFDSEIQRFISAGKKVNIIVYAIGYSTGQNPPTYVMSDPSVQKVNCNNVSSWPVVYSAAFKNAYKAFIAQVVQHYANDPHIGYIRFGLSRGGEVFAFCGKEEAALAALSLADWGTRIFMPYYKEMLDYEKSLNPTMQILAPTTQSGNPDFTDTEAPYAVAKGFGFGSQGLEKSDIKNYPSCTGDWCNLFSTYAGNVPLELQPIGQSDAAGALVVGTTSGSSSNNQALTGPLPPLLSFALQHHTTIFEIYTEDLLLALEPNYCNDLKQCNSQYGSTYATALAAVHGQ